MTAAMAPTVNGQPPAAAQPDQQHRLLQLANLDAEQGVIGAMLLDATAVFKAAALLTTSNFVREAHQLLFGAMLALSQRGVAIDHITIRDELSRTGDFERAGGLEYLADLIDTVPTAANIEWHAGLIREMAHRRELASHAQSAITMAYDRTQDIDLAVSTVVDRLARITHPESIGTAKAFRTEIWEVLEEVERYAKGGEAVTGIPCGIDRLDELTDGWVNGRLIVIASRPKVGKTGFALQCARAACHGETSVYFATAEQPRKELVKRLIGMESGVPLRSVTSEETLGMEATQLARAAGDLATWPITIDQVARTPAQVRLGIQRETAENGPPGLVIVDYLGKYHSGQKSERHDLEVGRVSGAFAEMGIALNVPVILLVQLNRQSVQGGQVRRPTPSDLRDSGAIEQDAAQLLFLYRDEKAALAEKDERWLQVFLDLNRFGPTGKVDVQFEKTTGRWQGYSKLPYSNS